MRPPHGNGVKTIFSMTSSPDVFVLPNLTFSSKTLFSNSPARLPRLTGTYSSTTPGSDLAKRIMQQPWQESIWQKLLTRNIDPPRDPAIPVLLPTKRALMPESA